MVPQRSGNPRQGSWEEWNDAGERIHLSHWHEGKQHGTEEWWNAAGVRIYLSRWNHGIEVPRAP